MREPFTQGRWIHQVQAYECCETEPGNWLGSFKVFECFTPRWQLTCTEIGCPDRSKMLKYPCSCSALNEVTSLLLSLILLVSLLECFVTCS